MSSIKKQKNKYETKIIKQNENYVLILPKKIVRQLNLTENNEYSLIFNDDNISVTFYKKASDEKANS